MHRIDEDSHGVGFFVKNEWARTIEPLQNGSKFTDSMWVRMPSNVIFNKPFTSESGTQSHVTVKTARELWVGVYYLAPRLSEGSLRDCIAEMSDVVRRAGDSGADCILMGDFNACLRADDDPLRRSSNTTIRDTLLMSLLQEHELVSLHELRPDCPLFTVMKGGTGRTMRDYIVVPRSFLEKWSDPRVHASVDLGSDHLLLTSSCKGIVTAVDAVVPAPRVSVVHGEQPIDRKPKVHSGWRLRELYPKIQDDKIPAIHNRAVELRESIAAGLLRVGLIEAQQFQDDASRSGVKPVVPNSYEAWTAAVHEVLDEVLKKNGSKRNRRRVPNHLTPAVWSALVRRRVAWTALRSAINAGATTVSVNELWNDYIEKKKTTVNLLAEARRAQWSEFSKEVASTPSGDRTHWRLLERMCGASNDSRWGPIKVGDRFIDVESRDYLPEWEQYYRSLGTRKATEATSPQWATVSDGLNREDFFTDVLNPKDSVLLMNGPLSVSEVRDALERLPNLKATGADGFSNEVLKALGPEALTGMLSMLWDREVSPDDWDLAILHPLKKVTGACHPSSSRGISLMSCVGKLFESILNSRLAQFLETEKVLIPEQGGFRPKRECIEHAIILFETLRRRKAERKSTFIGFIDFAKAFDTVWRNGLLFKLNRAGVTGKMLRMIRQMYAKTTASVRVNGRFTDTFPIELGVRQGGVLSPLLFLVFINDLLDRLKAEGIGVHIPGLVADNPFSAARSQAMRLSGLLWADDVALLTESPEQLARAFELIDQWCQDWLLDVNALKSNVMVVGRKPNRCRKALLAYAEQKPFMLGGGIVKPTESYKYLGILFSYKLSWEVAVEARLDAVRRTIFAKSKVFRNGDLSIDLRLKYFEAVVMPKALWGSELWADQAKDCNSMTAMVGQAVRMICFVPPRVSLRALGLELGLVPFTVQVALRRLRILLKWKQSRTTEEYSALWARRILISHDNRKGKSWGWIRKTKSFTKKRLGVAASEVNGLDRSSVMSNLDPSIIRDSAALRFYKKWCDESDAQSRTVLNWIHEHDTELKMSNFLRASISSKSMRVLLMARCGGLIFQDRISKFDLRTSAKCPQCSGGVIETFVHWLFDCPASAELRTQLATSWQVDPEELYQRSP